MIYGLEHALQNATHKMVAGLVSARRRLQIAFSTEIGSGAVKNGVRKNERRFVFFSARVITCTTNIKIAVQSKLSAKTDKNRFITDGTAKRKGGVMTQGPKRVPKIKISKK